MNGNGTKYPTLGELREEFGLDCKKVKHYLKPNGEFPNGDLSDMNKDVDVVYCGPNGCKLDCGINSGLKK